MVVLVLLNLVILLLVAIHPLFLVMIMMHVLMMNVTPRLDAHTLQLIAMITIHVPMILVFQKLVAIMKLMNVNTKMLAIL
jgi:hypothetical protein